MPFFLGVDGGGSKTRCLVGNEHSTLGTGISSGSKVQQLGAASAREALAGAIHDACLEAGISPRQISSTCAGVSGGGRRETTSVTEQLISSLVDGKVEVLGDVEIAFEDVFGSGPGVVVIAGTGSIAYARAHDGKTVRAGGWGHAISDAGSGDWIGREAVRVVLGVCDRGESASLLEALEERFGAKDFDDFIVRLNQNPAPDFACLFPLVLKAAETGDSLANEILVRAGRELASLAESVIRRLPEEAHPAVAVHGGVLVSGKSVIAAFAAHLQRRCPEARLMSEIVYPARGALKRARRAMGIVSSSTGDSV